MACFIELECADGRAVEEVAGAAVRLVAWALDTGGAFFDRVGAAFTPATVNLSTLGDLEGTNMGDAAVAVVE